MELRFFSARATKDIDLTYLNRFQDKAANQLVLSELQELAAIDL